MFEGILEKILLAKLGKYIVGLDKDNLKVGVWGGDIVLENVYLKPNALLLLQLPLLITYGKIVKLVIKVPWAKLSSAPVEVKLEGLYIIIATQDKSEWEYSEEGDIIERRELIEAYEQRRKQLQEQKLLSAEEELKEKGFLEKMSAKILDNLKFSIQNIHLRFENSTDNRVFAAGITLDKIECFTTNSELNPEFTDRHKAGSANICIYKLLNVVSLGFYWNSGEKSLKTDEDSEIMKTMQGLITNTNQSNYLIAPINAQAKIVHSNDLVNFEVPQYSASVSLPEITAIYKQHNFHDAVKTFEYFAEYQQFLMKIASRKKFQLLMPIERTPKNLWKGAISCILKTIKQRKDRSVNQFRPSAQVIKFYEESFKMLHRKLRKNNKLEDERLYNKIVLLCNIDLLYTWASHVQSVLEKEAKNPVKKKPTFSFWGKKPAEDAKADQPLEETYEKLFSEIESVPLPQYSMIPKFYAKIRFTLDLGSGVFKLVRNGISSEESLIFMYQGLLASTSLKVEGIDVELSMQDLSLSLYTEHIWQEIIKKEPSEEPLWKLNFKVKPSDDLAWSLESQFQSLEINYSLAFLQSVLSFFVVPETQNSAKNAAWDTIKGIQDSTQEALNDLLTGETNFSVKIFCSAPKIKLPSPTNQGFFLLNLGNIMIENETRADEYDYFYISMSSLGINYQGLSGAKSAVVPEFEIKTLLRILKAKYKIRPKNILPELTIEAKLPIFRINITSSIYHQLQRLHEIFNYSQGGKVNVESEAKVKGKLKKLVTGLHVWKEYNVALIGSYLYFYVSDKYEEPSSGIFYIKDCSIQDVSEVCQKENTLKLQNIYGECVFSLNSSKQYDDWKLILTEAINEMESYTSLAARQRVKQHERVLYSLDFEAPKVIVQLLNETPVKNLDIIITRLISKVTVRDLEFSFIGTLGHMEITEGVASRYSQLLNSRDSQDLISVSLDYIDPKSQNFENTDCTLKVRCGGVELNWNYELIILMLNFFQFAEYSDPTLMIKDSLGVVDVGHTLLSFEIESEEISIYLNNCAKEVTIAKASVNGFQSRFLLQNEGYTWTGTLGSLYIADMTNYPKTALEMPIEPFKLFSVLENNKLMYFKIIIYSDQFQDRNLDISSTLEIEMNSVNIVYLHQPFMRIIDFFNYHILGSFDTRSRAEAIEAASVIKSKIMEDALSFTSISVKIKEPVVHIPPRPGCSKFLAINLGTITVKNHLDKANNPGWMDIYEISMQKLRIFSNDLPVSEEFDIYLEVTRKLLTSEHLKASNLDKAYRVSGRSEGIKLNLRQRDYTLLLKTSDLNILYDDQLDSYINPTYTIIPYTPGEFLIVNFTIKTISILFLNEKLPIFELVCISNSISVKRFNDTTIEFSLVAENSLGLISEASVTSKDPNFAKMVNDVFTISYESLFEFYSYSDFCRLRFVLFGPVSSAHEPNLKVHLTSDLAMAKSVQVTISHMRINFHLSMLYQILNYLTSGIPNYSFSQFSPQDYITSLRPKDSMVTIELLQNYYAPKISASVDLKKSFIVLPSTQLLKTLVAYSDLNFIYIREKEDHKDGADVIKRLMLENFEIVHSKYQELLKHFEGKSKRKVLEPLSFVYETKSYKKNTEIVESWIIGSLNCALSYRDLLLLQSSYGFQQEMLVKDSGVIKTLETFEQLQIVEDKLELSSDDFIPSEPVVTALSTIYSFAGLNIIVINDALTAYTPIIDLSIAIGDKVVTSSECNGHSMFNGTLQIWSSYYNPIADTWEPFIEPFPLDFELTSTKGSGSNIMLNSSSEALNINLSEVMIKNFSDILKIWDSNSIECQEVISPFQIRNEIGYTIMVQYKYTEDVSIIESGCTIDHIIDYYSREQKLWKSDSIKVSIFPGDFQPQPLRVKTNKVQSNTVMSSGLPVVLDVKISATRKTLTIRSSLMITNETSYPVMLIFKKSSKSEERECLPGKSCPAPYDLYGAALSFQSLGERSAASLSLTNLCSCSTNQTFSLQIGFLHLLLFYKHSKHNSNRKTLYLRAPLLLRNLIPQTISLRLYAGRQGKFEEFEVKQQQTIANHSNSYQSELGCSIGLPGFARSNAFPLVASTRVVKLSDKKQQELQINIHKLADGGNTFIFYVSQVIVNNSLNPLAFYIESHGSQHLLPGQNFDNNVLPSNRTKKILIGIGKKRSKAFRIDSVGIQDIIELITDENPAGHAAKYEYTLDVQLVKVIESEIIFTRVVVISPRFLLVNNTESTIIVSQCHMDDYVNEVAPGAVVPFHWSDAHYTQLLRAKPNGMTWVLSGPFSIFNMGSFTIQSKNNSIHDNFWMAKVEVKAVGAVAHVVFEPETMANATYKIQNSSTVFSLVVHQKQFPEDKIFVNTSEVRLFTWSRCLEAHEVVVEFFIGSTVNGGVDTKSMYIINLDKLNQSLKIQIKEAPVDFDVIYVTVVNEGASRLLKFSDLLVSNAKDSNDAVLLYFSVCVPKLGLSLIEHSKHKSKEIMYFTLTQFIFLLQTTEKQYKSELMIKDFQGDNQMSHDAIFPVFLHVAEQTSRQIFHFCAILNKNSPQNSLSFESLEVLLQALVLKLDTHCVQKILELADRLILKPKSSADLFVIVDEYRRSSSSSVANISYNRIFYFSRLVVHPIKIIVSYVPLKEQGDRTDLLSGIATFGLALAAIESAPVRLHAIQTNEVLSTGERLKEALLNHYKSQMMNEFYSLIGHSSILGNPIGLINDLGTGVADFFYEPAQGMINGPISATEGFIKGTGSLIKNTLSGTFGTVSKLTSSITTGLAVLTQDKDYILERQRDMAKNKPSNVVTGVGLGVMSFFKNVGQGITGIVTEPIKGFKKDKVEGMMIGSIKGLSGLVVKPIAGALDMVSRSAEGIKNTANYFDKGVSYKIERPPRVIYGPLHLIQVYSHDDALLLEFLYKAKKNKYYNKEFVEQIVGNDKSDNVMVAAFFTDVMLWIVANKGKILWKANFKSIYGFEVRNDVLFIKIKKKKQDKLVKVEFANQSNVLAVEKKLMNLLQVSN